VLGGARGVPGVSSLVDLVPRTRFSDDLEEPQAAPADSRRGTTNEAALGGAAEAAGPSRGPTANDKKTFSSRAAAIQTGDAGDVAPAGGDDGEPAALGTSSAADEKAPIGGDGTAIGNQVDDHKGGAWSRSAGGRPRPPAAAATTTTSNLFEALAGVPDDFRPPERRQPPRILRGHDGVKFERVARECHEYVQRHNCQHGRGAQPEQLDTAADFRKFLWEYIEYPANVCVPVPKCSTAPIRYGRDALWDRIALSRLRFQDDRRQYVRVKRLDGRDRPLLTLHVPPAGGYDDKHAALQASYNDTGAHHRGGLRVNLDELLRHGAPAEEVERVRQGYKIALNTEPRRYHGRNYGGALDHPDKISAETERMVARGFVEGPLHYVPHVVQGLGGVGRRTRRSGAPSSTARLPASTRPASRWGPSTTCWRTCLHHSSRTCASRASTSPTPS